MTITATAHGRRQQLDEANERARNARAARKKARDVRDAARAARDDHAESIATMALTDAEIEVETAEQLQQWVLSTIGVGGSGARPPCSRTTRRRSGRWSGW